MGYYSLRDPIHNNDIINNGTLGLIYLAPVAKKNTQKNKTFNGITYFESSVLVRSLAIRIKKGEKCMNEERGKHLFG